MAINLKCPGHDCDSIVEVFAIERIEPYKAKGFFCRACVDLDRYHIGLNTIRECEQGCGHPAECYSADMIPGGWGGFYCHECTKALRFHILDNHTESTLHYQARKERERIRQEEEAWQAAHRVARNSASPISQNQSSTREGATHESN